MPYRIRLYIVSSIMLFVMFFSCGSNATVELTVDSSATNIIAGADVHSFQAPSSFLEGGHDFNVIWQEILHDVNPGPQNELTGILSTDIANTGLESPSYDAGLFLGKDIQEMVADLSYASSRPGFRLTQERLQSLRDSGVSEEVLDQLEALQGRRFGSEDLFWEAVEREVGSIEVLQVRNSILGYTPPLHDSDEYPSRFQSLEVSELSLESRENIEAWNMLFSYPRLARRTLAYESQRRAGGSRSAIQMEDDERFDVLGFFRRCGVPEPFTVVGFAILVYFVLAGLSSGIRRH